MQALPTSLPGVLIIEPKAFSDARGFFFESFNQRKFNEVTGTSMEFVQDNHSKSCQRVLRGLHFQIRQAQGKLVRVTEGEIYDVAVDIRRSSPTFGNWTGVRLSAQNRRQLWIPPGFAHGFVVLSDEAQLLYKTTDYWAPEHERTLAWDDPQLGIEWPIEGAPILSQKDQVGQRLSDIEVFA